MGATVDGQPIEGTQAMRLDRMKIEYSENSTGRHTDIGYSDDAGTPMAARLPGWRGPVEVASFLERSRNLDRNKSLHDG